MEEECRLATVIDTVGPEVEGVDVSVEVTLVKVEGDGEVMVEDEDGRAVVAEESNCVVVVVVDEVAGNLLMEDGDAGVVVVGDRGVFIEAAVDVSAEVKFIGYVSLEVLALEVGVEKVVRAPVEVKRMSNLLILFKLRIIKKQYNTLL